ncbi:MAG: Trp family transcriptional regulator [Candidatus Saccharimonadales bacterium]
MKKFEELVWLLHSIKDKDALESYLQGLTTAHERRALSRRLEIIKKLKTGKTQHEVANELRVGVATVTRWSKETARFKSLK